MGGGNIDPKPSIITLRLIPIIVGVMLFVFAYFAHRYQLGVSVGILLAMAGIHLIGGLIVAFMLRR